MISNFFILIFFLIVFILGLKINHKSGTLPQGVFLFIFVFGLSTLKFSITGLQVDELTYQAYAIIYSNNLDTTLRSFNTSISDGKELYIIILGFLYWVFTPEPYLGFLVNSFFIMLMPAILQNTFINFRIESRPNLITVILLFSPIFIWSIGLTRESISFFLIAVYLYVLSLIYKEKILVAFLIFILLLLVVINFRSLLLPFLLLGFLIFIFNFLLSKSSIILQLKNKLYLKLISLALVVTLVIFAIKFIAQYIQSNFSGAISELASPSFRSYAEYSSSTFNFTFNGYFYNLFRSVIGPYFIEFNNPIIILFALEGLYYFSILVLFIFYLFHINYKRLFFLFFISILPFLIINNFYFTNYGLNSRVKAHMLMMFFPIIYIIFSKTYNIFRESYESIRE